MDGTACRAANTTPDMLLRRDPTLADRARPHVQAVRGLSGPEARAYAWEHQLTPDVLMVAEAFAAEADIVLARAGGVS